ncbi:cyclopropane fatty acyl phospholipid synthase [Jannaschia seosinensis]|uniref:Cyclopropane fatty acyl phospholipid synthase n=2 Tax=Jannaschia seosinensis TaxID=313367 RepID=A0A0M7B9N1_9RHOB|nr:cyclopropane fatty acyl phospholipid synthase [Jannaschia seosinensis]
MPAAPMKLTGQQRRTGLEDRRSFSPGHSYSTTPRRRIARFNSRWNEIVEQGFEERFPRMWNLDLTGCAGVFECGISDVIWTTVRKVS